MLSITTIYVLHYDGSSESLPPALIPIPHAFRSHWLLSGSAVKPHETSWRYWYTRPNKPDLTALLRLELQSCVKPLVLLAKAEWDMMGGTAWAK